MRQSETRASQLTGDTSVRRTADRLPTADYRCRLMHYKHFSGTTIGSASAPLRVTVRNYAASAPSRLSPLAPFSAYLHAGVVCLCFPYFPETRKEPFDEVDVSLLDTK